MSARASRRAIFETLEPRQVLSGISAIASPGTVGIGAPVLVPIVDTDSSAVGFTATSSNSGVTATVLKTSHLLKMQVHGTSPDGSAFSGEMDFLLFDDYAPNNTSRIQTLANSTPSSVFPSNSTKHFYDGLTFHRIIQNFMIQGGDPNGNGTGGTGTKLNDEFNPDIRYTTSGLLALANSGPNTNDSQFFITAAPFRSGDYQYTIIGKLVAGEAIRQKLAAVSVTTQNGELSKPVTPPVIDSVTVVNNTNDAVLMLKAAPGATGSATITVTAAGTSVSPTSQQFSVQAGADSGLVVANPWSSQTPAAPTSVQLVVSAGQSTAVTNVNNANSSSKLQFRVSDVTSGNVVTVYSDGAAIGQATATGNSVTVTTDGTTKLFDGLHKITAVQTAPGQSASYTISGTTRTDSANVASLSSPAASLTVFTNLQVTNTPSNVAVVSQTYNYKVQTNAPTGVTIASVTTSAIPSGMNGDGTGNFTWVPTDAQKNTTQTLTFHVTDSLGNTADLGPTSISVTATLPPVQIPTDTVHGGNVTVSFSGNTVIVFNNQANSQLASMAFTANDTVLVQCPDGQANVVTIVLPSGTGAALPKNVSVQGGANPTNNKVIIQGTSGTNSFTLAGGTITANGLPTALSGVTLLQFNGGTGTDTYKLTSSNSNVAIVDGGGSNTLDFSGVTGGTGITIDLGKDQGQAQTIAPWNKTLAITGVIGELIGTSFADTITGGSARTTIIRCGAGNDTVTGGSGDSIIVGGGGRNTFTGGRGHNLLIAGAGASRLTGSGLSNVLVGGATNYDAAGNANDQALMGLLSDRSTRSILGWSFRRAFASARNRPASQTLFKVQQGSGNTLVGGTGPSWFLPSKTDVYSKKK